MRASVTRERGCPRSQKLVTGCRVGRSHPPSPRIPTCCHEPHPHPLSRDPGLLLPASLHPALKARGGRVRTTGPLCYPAGFSLRAPVMVHTPSSQTCCLGHPMPAHQPCASFGAHSGSAFMPHPGPVCGPALWTTSSEGSDLAWVTCTHQPQVWLSTHALGSYASWAHKAGAAAWPPSPVEAGRVKYVECRGISSRAVTP